MRELEDQDPPETAQAPPSRLGRVLQSLSLAGATGVVALVTGSLALLFTLFPDIKPFSPTKLSARAEIVRVDRAVTRDQWRVQVAVGDPARYQQLVADDLQSSQFTDRCGPGPVQGYVIYVRTDAEGYKRKQLRVRAQLYDARDEYRIPTPEQYVTLARVPVDAPTAVSISEVWLWDPAHRGAKYFAQAEIYDPGDHLLDVATSKPFRSITNSESRKLPKGCQPPPPAPARGRQAAANVP
jgi:hypothetical protein